MFFFNQAVGIKEDMIYLELAFINFGKICYSHSMLNLCGLFENIEINFIGADHFQIKMNKIKWQRVTEKSFKLFFYEFGKFLNQKLLFGCVNLYG